MTTRPTPPLPAEPLPQPSLLGRLKTFLTTVLARASSTCTGLCRELSRFSRRLEEGVFPEARERGAALVTLRVGEHEGRPVLHTRRDGILPDTGRLAGFLGSLGVSEWRLDTGLQSNQITDVIQMLWGIRQTIRTEARPGLVQRALGHERLAEALRADPTKPDTGQGLHMSCARVFLDRAEGTLCIRSSPCALAFSRAVEVYKRQASAFRDHRAFFRAAPRYALFVLLISLAPLAAHYAFGTSGLPLILSGVLAAGVLTAAVYLLLQTIGSVEYDKEYQARELARQHRLLEGAHSRIQRDLRAARRIQRGLLPDESLRPFSDHIELAWRFDPEMAVGGDHFDLSARGDSELDLLLADVAGHGMAAAFVTGIIKTSFELVGAQERPTNAFILDLSNTLVRLTPSDHFAAIVYARYHVHTRELRYTDAGHNPLPMVVRHDGGRVESLSGPIGLLAGVLPGIPYEEGTVNLAPGDKLVLCTDGFTEARNPEGALFGIEPLKEILRNAADLSARETVQRILDALDAHTAEAEASDDRTLLVMRVLK